MTSTFRIDDAVVPLGSPRMNGLLPERKKQKKIFCRQHQMQENMLNSTWSCLKLLKNDGLKMTEVLRHKVYQVLMTSDVSRCQHLRNAAYARTQYQNSK